MSLPHSIRGLPHVDLICMQSCKSTHFLVSLDLFWIVYIRAGSQLKPALQSFSNYPIWSAPSQHAQASAWWVSGAAQESHTRIKGNYTHTAYLTTSELINDPKFTTNKKIFSVFYREILYCAIYFLITRKLSCSPRDTLSCGNPLKKCCVTMTALEFSSSQSVSVSLSMC